jgi:hypothetical protein
LRGGIVGTAVGAVVGGAAVGVVTHLANRRSRAKVLSIPIPNELNPKRLDVAKLAKAVDGNGLTSHLDVKRLRRNIDLKDVIRQVGDLAEHVETQSEHVHTLSGQAKRLSRRIS